MSQQSQVVSLEPTRREARGLVNDLEEPLVGTVHALAASCMGMDPQRQAVIKLDQVNGRHRYAVMNRADVPSLNDLPALEKGQRLRILEAQKAGEGFLVMKVSAL